MARTQMRAYTDYQINRAVIAANGNLVQVARRLGISHQAVYRSQARFGKEKAAAKVAREAVKARWNKNQGVRAMGRKRAFTDDELRQAMEAADGDRYKAAKRLGVTERTVVGYWRVIERADNRAKIQEQVHTSIDQMRAEGKLDVALKPPAGNQRPRSCKRPPPDDGSIAMSELEAIRKMLIEKRRQKRERRKLEVERKAACTDKRRKPEVTEAEKVAGLTFNVGDGPPADTHYTHGARAGAFLEHTTPDNWRVMYASAVVELGRALAIPLTKLEEVELEEEEEEGKEGEGREEATGVAVGKSGLVVFDDMG